MRNKNILLLTIIFIVIFVTSVHAQNIDQSRQDRIDFGYVLNVKNVSTDPQYLSPGIPGKLKVVLENNANFPLYDIRVQVNLSNQILFLNDISKRKIPRMESGEDIEIEYNIIVLPDAVESVYASQLNITYVNHVGTERQELDNFGIVVKADPKIFVQIEETELTTDNKVGTVTIRVVNNNIGDIKFLTIQLMDSPEYKVLSTDTEYVGDLDSDDFDSIDFRVSLNSDKEEIILPIKIDYKDSLNQDYSHNLNLGLSLPTSAESGTSQGLLGFQSIIIVLIILVVGFYLYRRYKIKRVKQQKY